MKNQLITVIIAMTSLISALAQGNPSASLFHDGEIKIFQSSKALQDAVDTALPGDIITLSPGTYQACDITKPLAIRGAGMGSLDATMGNQYPTYIIGDFVIDVPTTDDGYSFSMEGIEHSGQVIRIKNLTNAIFAKTKSNSIIFDREDNKTINNITFFHCIINLLGNYMPSTFTAYNSIMGVEDSSGGMYQFTYNNCIVTKHSGRNETFNNCIITGGGRTSSGVIIKNSIIIDTTLNDIDGNRDNDNVIVEKGVNLYDENGGFYRLAEPFAYYTGSDGAQIGIYGGGHPFNIKPSYPQIKNFKVAPESTSEGMLKIEFDVDVN